MQLELRLMGRIDGATSAPSEFVTLAKTYRQAVRLSWELRRIKNMTMRSLAEVAGLYPSHVSDYLAADDKATRRDLPADKINEFSMAVGNTLVAQWVASQASLTVLEQMQADALQARAA